MNEREQTIKMKCPHCGWIRSLSLAIEEDSFTDVVRGPIDELKKAAARIKAALTDSKLNEANERLDMPKCSNCGNVYRYNLRTREVSK
jgi:RNase P subunit RPR2